MGSRIAAGSVLVLLALGAGCGQQQEEPPASGSDATSAAASGESSPTATESESEPAAASETPSGSDAAAPPASPAELAAALRRATWRGDTGRAARLIEAGADVNAKDGTQQSPYLIAASEGRNDILELALRNGAEVNDHDRFDGTALIRAAERGHDWITGRLVRTRIDVDHVNRLGWQAVHEAVWLGEDTAEYRTTVRALVAGGAELDRPSGKEGLTPLQMAEQKGHDGQAAALRTTLEAPRILGDVTAVLQDAAARGDADRVALALRRGADLDARNGLDQTPLMVAATRDHVEVARLLVAMGADPDALDGRHDTPWLITGVTGSVPMLEAVLPAHPDLTLTNRSGGLSVTAAAERGHVGYVRRVVRTGIDLDHVDDRGMTPLDHARAQGHDEVVRILERS